MPRTCLIGYTGFIGSNLKRQHDFTEYYRSTNIDRIRGEHYDLMVCAGVSAAKWQANQRPDEDRAAIDSLVDHLSQVRASRVILISTVDVYPVTKGVDESFECGGHPNHAYGSNRLQLEKTLGALFPELYIARLPAVFGPGLKKNVIYDLLHNNCLGAIDPGSTFQYYDTTCLWRDLQVMQKSQAPIVNLATEPIVTRTIVETYFPGAQIGPGSASPAYYDVRSLYADAFGGRNGYRFDASEVLYRLGKFIHMTRGGASA